MIYFEVICDTTNVQTPQCSSSVHTSPICQVILWNSFPASSNTHYMTLRPIRPCNLCSHRTSMPGECIRHCYSGKWNRLMSKLSPLKNDFFRFVSWIYEFSFLWHKNFFPDIFSEKQHKNLHTNSAGSGKAWYENFEQTGNEEWKMKNVDSGKGLII